MRRVAKEIGGDDLVRRNRSEEEGAVVVKYANGRGESSRESDSEN